MSGDIRILDGKHLVNVLAFDPLCREGGRGDGRTTAEGFKFRFLDDAILVDLNLQLRGRGFMKYQKRETRVRRMNLLPLTMICWEIIYLHHIATCWRSNKSLRVVVGHG